ncbi:MAG: hypothetical protein BZY80_03070 [SAR202 cluster bacterium Io17-Chloro-G2]|nr:MAG: hypothetical protein BZY80_03070 [SAR202 cluster bacterium Io17-Chloro-G2]
MPVRPVFIVHGIGNQKKGEVLTAVVEPWVQFLGKHLGIENVHLEADIRPQTGPAHATITFGDERWEIWEAYWAQSFHPLKDVRVLTWGFSTLLRQTWSIFRGFNYFSKREPYPNPSPFVYHRRPIGWTAWVSDKLVGYLAVTLFVPLYVMSLLAASVFFVLSQLPVGAIQPKLGEVVTKLTEALVQGPGDMAAILLSETRLASMKNELKQLMLSKISSGPAGEPAPERATVIAHSAGATVAFAALSDGSLWDAWDHGMPGPKEISFLTVGSSLNLAWRSDSNHPIWKRGLDPRVRWIDFWARYDPVPHGPAAREMQAEARGRNEGFFESVRVINLDNPFTDHVTYWGNHPEVVSRFALEIAGLSEETVAGAEEADGNLPPEREALVKAVRVALNDIQGHRIRIGAMSLLRAFVPFATLAVVTALDFATPWDTASFLGGPLLEIMLPGEQQINGVVAWLAGVAVIAVALYALWQFVRLWFVEPKLSKDYPALGRGKKLG